LVSALINLWQQILVCSKKNGFPPTRKQKIRKLLK
jgi:hypothetical protein